jgi:hypothetical protein
MRQDRSAKGFPPDRGWSRRDVVKRGALALAACGLDPFHSTGLARAADEEPRADATASSLPAVQHYATLGRTGLSVSDISFGSSRTKDPLVVRHALERGINYFDTAESYPLGDEGAAERAIGEALRGHRNEVSIASKVAAEADDRRDKLMRALEGSLVRLGTDRIDVYFNHAVNDPARLKNPEWHEFTALAKKQGKIRFSGISGHGGRLVECLDIAIADNLVDVVLVAHNFGHDPKFIERFTKSLDVIATQQGLPEVLARARSKGIGVVAMKTLMGARLNDLRPYERPGGTFAQAAFRWVLSSGHVDALIVSMSSPETIDEYLGASGTAELRKSDAALLHRYVRLNSGLYCRPACSACESSCPEDVPVSEVLRARMYALDYRDVDGARAAFRELGPVATACATCSGEPCLGACPHGLPIATLTRSTVRLLA